MATGEVKVLGSWSSPYVIRTRIALHIKSINYEFVEEKLLEGKSELLLKSNPVYKKIPVLIHRDKPINESLIILQYIDQTWPSAPSILPSHPYDSAVARFWAAYLDEKWFPAVISVGIADGEEAKKAGIAQLEEGLALMEEAFGKCTKGKGFFGGDEIGFLDIAFGSFLGGLRVTEKINGISLMDEAKTPALVNWAERFCCHAAVKDVMPDVDELTEFGKMLLARIRAAAEIH
ncbi:GLUTATHIONE S-TRANSFERASE 29, glutathione S-transferase TAU 18 [Hibiscus trionum]|uniref:Glutathione S-transferase n=1 Tax=Hibiscus trionum TaxID=183268 RepID=A0A9W7MGG8_HIBTR|nr:GLUTATHIONE S-TRANSFERASE 29, glutathione S-transferase TAU 18 [Hibiscus trionum]